MTTPISTQTHALAPSRRKVGTVIRVDNEPKTARLHVTLSVIQVGKVPHNKSRALLHCRWRRNSGGKLVEVLEVDRGAWSVRAFSYGKFLSR